MTQIRLIKANKIQTWDFGLSQWFILRSHFHLCRVGVSGREAPDSTDTPCTTGGERAWEWGRRRGDRAGKEEETGLRSSLSCGPWSSARWGHRPLCRLLFISVVMLLLWPANWRFSSDSVYYFLYSSVLSAFWKDLLIKTYFLSSESTQSCTDWLRKVRTPSGGWTPSKIEGKKKKTEGEKKWDYSATRHFETLTL